MKPVVLNPAALDLLRAELGQHGQSLPLIRGAIEAVLTQYRAVRQADVSPQAMARCRRQAAARVKVARQLLMLIDGGSLEDWREARARGGDTSPLQDALHARIEQWTLRARRASRPKDWARRILLFRVMGILDDTDVPRTYHREGARMRVLRLVLQFADSLDGRRSSQGSLRLIEDVYADRKMVGTLKDAAVAGGRAFELHCWYMHTPTWPSGCGCPGYTKLAPPARTSVD
jgi:hypothetical protein